MCCQILKPKVPAHFNSAGVSCTADYHQDTQCLLHLSEFLYPLAQSLNERMHFGTSLL